MFRVLATMNPRIRINYALALALGTAVLLGPARPVDASGPSPRSLPHGAPAGFAPEPLTPAALGPAPSTPGLGRTSAILLAGGVAGFLSWQTEDPDQAVRTLEASPFEGPIDIGDAYANGLVLGSTALGTMAIGRLAHEPRLQVFGGDLTRSLLVTSAAVWALKVGINRTRPNGADYSFPSGHTATAFCAAPVFQKHFGWKVGLPAYALAVGAGLGRMEDRKHFLSDVVVGAALGLAVGDAVIRPGFAGDLMDRIAVGRSGVGLRLRF